MIETVSNKVLYIVDSSTQQKYPFPIRFFQPEDLRVYLTPPGGTEKQLEYGADWKIDQQTDYSEGTNVYLLSPQTVGGSLAIVREMDITQLLDLQEYGKFPSDSMEKALDRIVMICQQLKEQCDRAIQVGASESVQTPADILSLIGGLIGQAKDSAAAAQDSAEAALASAKSAAASAKSADASAEAALASAKSAAASAQGAESARKKAEELINQFQSSQGLGMVEIIDSIHTAASFDSLPVGYRYKYTKPLTALALKSSERSVRECEFEFVAASSGIEVEFPDSLAVSGLVEFEANGHYLINIRYGIAVVAVFSPGSGSGSGGGNGGGNGGGTGGGDDDDDNGNSGGDVSGNWGDNWVVGDPVPDRNVLAIKEVGNNSDSTFKRKYTVAVGKSIALETSIIGNDIVNLPGKIIMKIWDAADGITAQDYFTGAEPDAAGIVSGAVLIKSTAAGTVKVGAVCPPDAVENEGMAYLPASAAVTVEFK